MITRQKTTKLVVYPLLSLLVLVGLYFYLPVAFPNYNWCNLPVFAAVCSVKNDCAKYGNWFECQNGCCIGCVYGNSSSDKDFGPFRQACSGSDTTSTRQFCKPPPPTPTPEPPPTPTPTPKPPPKKPKPTATKVYIPPAPTPTPTPSVSCVSNIYQLPDKYGQEGIEALAWAIEEDLVQLPFCPADTLVFLDLVQILNSMDGPNVSEIVARFYSDKDVSSEVTRGEAAGAVIFFGFPGYQEPYEGVFQDVPVGYAYSVQVEGMVKLKLYEKGLGPPIFSPDQPARNIQPIIWLHRLELTKGER